MSIARRLKALERAIVESEGEEAAAAAVCEAVVGGASANIERLVAALDATSGTVVRSKIAVALTIDLIRRGDVAGWTALHTRRRGTLDNALIDADEAGCDVRAAILALPAAERSTPTVPAIVRWCKRDRKARTSYLVENLALDRVAAFVRYWHEERGSLRPWVARLGEVLSSVRESSVRARAAELLRAAGKGACKLAVVRDALRDALDDATYFENPAHDAAYALTLAGEAGLDRDPRAAVRMGAWRVRPSFLGLLDPEPQNRRLIAAALREQIASDAASCPSRDETQCLVAELLDPVVGELVYAVIDRGEVATVIAGIEPRGAARHFVAAARAVLAHAPAPVCRRCRVIPRLDSGTNVTVPEREFTQEGPGRLRCIECGAAYRVSSYEYESDIGTKYHVTLERLPPDDPADVARWRDRLDHPETWARRDAAWIVARAAVSSGDTATIDELVAHRDVDIRSETWRVLPVSALSRALDDPDKEIRSHAAGRLFEGADAAVLVDLLGRDHVVAHTTTVLMNWRKQYPAEVVQALRTRMLAARQQQNPDSALATVCRVLGGALAHTPDPTIVAEAVEIVLGAPPAIQVCVLHVIVGCGANADTSALDDKLLELLHQVETRSEAIHLLDARATAGQLLRIDHLKAIATVLDPDHSARNGRAMSVFSQAVRTPATQAAGFSGLFALLDTGIETTAASKIHELARELPLGDAVPQLIGLAAKTTHGYVRQELINALLVDAKRRGDSALVTALVEHPHPGVAATARYALRG